MEFNQLNEIYRIIYVNFDLEKSREINCQITEYFNEMETIQKKILKLIDANEKNVKKIKFQKLLQLLDNLQIKENKYDLNSFFHLLTKIFVNHHHQFDFINYVEKTIT